MTETRNERRRQKTRQLLLDATVELLKDNELEDFTPEDITETADVGRRTFYNYFDNKNDCVLAAVKQRFTQYVEEVASSEERQKDPITSLSNSACKVFDDISQDPLTVRLVTHPQLLADAVAESQGEFILFDLANGIEVGLFNPIAEMEVMEPIILWGFVGLVMKAVTTPKAGISGLDWMRVILHNLGLSAKQIEGAIKQVDK